MSSGTEIVFTKGPGTRYHAVLHRSDGVQVRLEGGSWNKIGGRPGRVPHDLAHLVVEDAFGLERGLWGVLAAGGTVQNASVIAGRQPPHAARRAEAIVAPARPMLRQAEVLVRAAADCSLAEAPGDLSAFREAATPVWLRGLAVTPTVLASIEARLQSEATAWAAVPDEDTYRIVWPR